MVHLKMLKCLEDSQFQRGRWSILELFWISNQLEMHQLAVHFKEEDGPLQTEDGLLQTGRRSITNGQESKSRSRLIVTHPCQCHDLASMSSLPLHVLCHQHHQPHLQGACWSLCHSSASSSMWLGSMFMWSGSPK